jgi:hypothetical protein
MESRIARMSSTVVLGLTTQSRMIVSPACLDGRQKAKPVARARSDQAS